jgi:hypothetical protein
MEYEEDVAGKEGIREKVLVPVQRHQPANEEEAAIPGEPVEPKIWTTPRRWYVY